MKKLVSLLMFTLISGLLFSACSTPPQSSGQTDPKTVLPGDSRSAPANPVATPAVTAAEGEKYRAITPEEAKELIGQENTLLVDVRTEEEYAEAHIPGSVLLPLDDIKSKAESVLKDKQAVIIVYCRSGRRSSMAAQELAGMGYAKLYDLGGIQDWPYETVSGLK